MDNLSILNKILGNKCKIYLKEDFRKYIDRNNEELYKIECIGFIKKKNLIDSKNTKNYTEINLID